MTDRLPFAVGMGVLGWCAGWLSAWYTERLQAADDEHDTIAGRGGLVRDPIVQAGCALVWAAAPLALQGGWWRWLEAGLLGVPLIQVAVTDLRTRYVYSPVAAIGVVFGLAFAWHFHDVEWWTSLAGGAGAFATFGGLYLLGRLLYRGQGVEAMARGDIDIAAMVGAGAAACTAQALFYGVLLGGVFAAATWLARRSRHGYMPYGPGLCLGGLATLFLC